MTGTSATPSITSTSVAPADGEVVVGTDGTWHSAQALSRAAIEADLRGLPLVVLQIVATTVDTYLSVRVQREVHAGRLDQAHESTQAAARGLRAAHPGLTVRTEVVIGREPADLVTALQRCQLLVVGDGSDRGRRAFLLGSTSRDLVRAISCPVLVLCEPADPVNSEQPDDSLLAGSVLAGVDTVATDLAVIREAAAEAQRLGTRLVVLHSYRPGCSDPSTAHHEVRALIEAADLPVDVVVSVVVTADEPGHALLEHSPGVAVIVVGSRGPLALARLALGSVSRAVLDSVRVPVLVVPRPRSADG